jgi:hypothetical protein
MSVLWKIKRSPNTCPVLKWLLHSFTDTIIASTTHYSYILLGGPGFVVDIYVCAAL